MEIKEREILKFKPKLHDDLIYYKRFENNGNVSIKYQGANSSKMVNSAFYSIMNLCNGTNTVETIILKMQKMYSKVEKNLIKSDVINTIYKLTQMQLVENHYDLQKTELNRFGKSNNIYSCAHFDVSRIRVLYESHQPNCYYLNPQNVIYDKFVIDYSVLYEEQSHIFEIEENGDFIGTINWRQIGSDAVVLDHVAYIKEFHFSHALSKSINLVFIASKQAITKFMVYCSEDSSDIIRFLKLGYVKTGFFSKEIVDSSIVELTYIYDYE